MKANRLFAKRRVSRMSRKGVLIAEQPESSSREETGAEIEALAAEIGGK